MVKKNYLKNNIKKYLERIYEKKNITHRKYILLMNKTKKIYHWKFLKENTKNHLTLKYIKIQNLQQNPSPVPF